MYFEHRFMLVFRFTQVEKLIYYFFMLLGLDLALQKSTHMIICVEIIKLLQSAI